jgi:hypothetical protein
MKKKPAPAPKRRARPAATALVPSRLPFPCHGALELPTLDVESYNITLRERGEFVGDRASKTAFAERIDAWRAIARRQGKDPFGRRHTQELGKKTLERILRSGNADAAGIVQSALDDFARALVEVIVRFRKHAWQRVERISIGGGFREGRLGELAIGRARALLAEQSIPIDLQPIHHHPDEAGLIGTVHLLPAWMLDAGQCVLAVDIGGNNVRCGIVGYKIGRGRRVRKAEVIDSVLWRHKDDEANRTEVVGEIIGMLQGLAASARKQRLRLLPLVGIGCPGHIVFDGRIVRGSQNLPGDWEGARFHLPTLLRAGIGEIAGQKASVIMHNDAVVQGLSEIPFVGDAAHWGVLTIGTGLGNAAFKRREQE